LIAAEVIRFIPTFELFANTRTFLFPKSLIPLRRVVRINAAWNILLSMRISSLTLLLVLCLTACAAQSAVPTALPAPSSTPTPFPSATPEPLTGAWIGGVTKPDGSSASLLLNFDTSKLNIEPLTASWSMTVTQNAEGINLSAAGKSNDPFTEIEFAGTVSEGNLTGEISWDGQKSSVIFTPIVAVDSSVLEKYEGLYRFDSGRTLSIIVSPKFSAGGLQFFSQTLMMTDFESGALRGLYPIDGSTFLIGGLRVVGAPFNGRIQFDEDNQGNVQGLRWWETPNDLFNSPVPNFYASRVAYTSEDITFTSADGIKLAGRLSLPETGSPAPAFMMLHGSEQGTRDNFGNKVMAHYMISQGFAILNYDKRGVGDSEGTYQEAASPTNLQRHADDAIAGVEYLASRPEIDSKRIGLIGFSQAGWVIPLAASQSNVISHIVILSGPVASTSHENLFSDYTNDGESIKNFEDAEITQRLRELNPGGFDPVPVISKLHQSGVWLWGSVDKSVPVTFSAENLQALIDSGKSNFSYQILPNGDHNLNSSANGLFAEIPYSPGVLFYSTLAEWLEANMSAN
jgi:dienelactone hydrolase